MISKTWDEVEDRFRELGQLKSFTSMSTRMLEVVAALRSDPKLERFDHWVSHVSLIFGDGNRCVAVAYSEPGGMAWAGSPGFVVYAVDFGEMASSRHVVVEEGAVVDAVLERFAS